MRLAIGEPAANRRPDTRGVLGIDGVHVEAQVEERTAARVLERLAHAELDAALVEIAHREHLRLEPLQQLRSPWSSERTPTSASLPGSIAGSVQSS